MKQGQQGPDSAVAREEQRDERPDSFEKLPGRKARATARTSIGPRDRERKDAVDPETLRRTGLVLGVILLLILGFGAWLILTGVF
jgi:hypothetical protein